LQHDAARKSIAAPFAGEISADGGSQAVKP
jgi:hypothetical protein